MEKQGTILIVDDLEVNRVVMGEIFEQDYHVLYAADGFETLNLLRKHGNEIILVLLDLMMPGKDGFAVLSEMKEDERIPDIPVIVVTVHGETENEVRALSIGATDLFLKPIEPQIVKCRVQNVLEAHHYKNQLEQKLRLQKLRLETAHQTITTTLQNIMSHRNMESSHHLLRISEWTKILLHSLARESKKYYLPDDKIECISVATLLHDVGMISLHDAIINKTGCKTKEEIAIISQHCMEGCKILSIFDQSDQKQLIEYAYNICRYHHENWDGSGYPDGIYNDNIPFYAQAVSLANAYDDLIYESNCSHEDAVNNIKNCAKIFFSKELVTAFLNIQDQFRQIDELYKKKSVASCNKLISDSLEKAFDEPCVDPQISSPNYYSLLRFLDAAVFELDIKTGKYKRIFTGYSDFTGLQQCGSYHNDLIHFIRTNLKQEYCDNTIPWLFNITKVWDQKNIISTGETCQIYNEFSKEYQWYRISFVKMEDETSPSQKLLLIFKNVNQEIKIKSEMMKAKDTAEIALQDLNRYKRENEDLKIIAHVDQLTGLLNKAATKQAIKDILEVNPNNCHALLVIDFDNFKTINDCFGHLEGDRALRAFGSAIKSQFRTSDVVGRIGGDEFSVLISHITNTQNLIAKVDNLLNSIRLMGEGMDGYRYMTASIGISTYPECGRDYDTLFKNADMALYLAKKLGKDQWRMYSKSTAGQTNSGRTHRDELSDSIQKEKEISKLIESIICESDNEFELMEQLLTVAARRYHLECAYIIEAENFNILFRWTAGIDSMKKFNNIFSINSEIKLKFSEAIHCHELYFSEKAAIMTMPARIEETLLGWVIFFDLNSARNWTEEEVRFCRNISKFASSTLYRKKLELELMQYKEINKITFDISDLESYIVDGSYQVLRVNEQMQKLYGIQPNEKCYQAFFHQERPCDDCPIKKLTKQCNKVQLQKRYGMKQELYSVSASGFFWNVNLPAYLLTLKSQTS